MGGTDLAQNDFRGPERHRHQQSGTAGARNHALGAKVFRLFFVNDPMLVRKRENPTAGLGVSRPAVKASPHALDNSMLAALREGHSEFLRFAIRRTRSVAAGESLVQEFYREATRTVAMIKFSGSVKQWLVSTARRVLAEYQRAADLASGESHLDEPVAMFIDDVERTINGCLYRILPTLPNDSAWLIWQLDLLNQPAVRVARNLGVSPEELAQRLRRAHKIMLEVLSRFSKTCLDHGFLNCTCE
jgi:DNA-directed RNA polymerase specialized sigma24 family protein